jgi:hypothetical protein
VKRETEERMKGREEKARQMREKHAPLIEAEQKSQQRQRDEHNVLRESRRQLEIEEGRSRKGEFELAMAKLEDVEEREAARRNEEEDKAQEQEMADSGYPPPTSLSEKIILCDRLKLATAIKKANSAVAFVKMARALLGSDETSTGEGSCIFIYDIAT